jgi:hypothetical protein
MTEIEQLEQALVTALKKTRQGSYARRAPAPESAPMLLDVRGRARELLSNGHRDPRLWRALSLAEEALLNYRAALQAHLIQLAMQQSESRKEAKRTVALAEGAGFWDAVRLSPDELAALGAYLEGFQELSSRDFARVTRWLTTCGHVDPDALIDSLRSQGALSDFDVYWRLVRG